MRLAAGIAIIIIKALLVPSMFWLFMNANRDAGIAPVGCLLMHLLGWRGMVILDRLRERLKI